MQNTTSYNNTPEDNQDESNFFYTEQSNLQPGHTYFTDKTQWYGLADGSQKEYFGSWLWETELINQIEKYNDISTSLLLNTFCVPVLVKEINNNTIILLLQNNLIQESEEEVSIARGNEEQARFNTIKVKSRIIYYLSFFSENFTSKKTKSYLKHIENEVYRVLDTPDEEIEIDRFIDNLKLLLKDFVYSLNGKEKTFLLEQEIEQDLSINGMLILLALYLYDKSENSDE